MDAQELTLAQAASLAASIKAPSYYAPSASKEANQSRRNYILSTMLTEGMIDQKAHDRARDEAVVVAQKEPEVFEHGWFVDAVLLEAEKILGLSSDEVLNGGYVIDTTLSREHQQVLEKQGVQLHWNL